MRRRSILRPPIGMFIIMIISGIGAAGIFSRVLFIEVIDVFASPGIEARTIRQIAFEQMDTRRFGILPQKNILVFSDAQFKKELLRRFAVDTLRIKKRFPHTVRIDIEGQPFRLIMVTGSRVFDMASDGSVSSDLSNAVTDGKPVLALALALAKGADPLSVIKPADAIDTPIAVRSDASPENTDSAQTVDSAALLFMRDAFTRAHDTGYKPLYFMYSANTPTITMKTVEGWNVVLSVLEPADAQIARVRTVLDAYFKKVKNRKKLEYIDARFDNRVFYK